MEELEKAEFDSFIKKIRQQAVKDFWWYEREAIKNGEYTREWTAEQIEAIMNISTEYGSEGSDSGKSIVLDEAGN